VHVQSLPGLNTPTPTNVMVAAMAAAVAAAAGTAVSTSALDDGEALTRRWHRGCECWVLTWIGSVAHADKDPKSLASKKARSRKAANLAGKSLAQSAAHWALALAVGGLGRHGDRHSCPGADHPNVCPHRAAAVPERGGGRGGGGPAGAQR
jgi:hypothetical protein